jgi:hypothetical protein
MPCPAAYAEKKEPAGPFAQFKEQIRSAFDG